MLGVRQRRLAHYVAAALIFTNVVHGVKEGLRVAPPTIRWPYDALSDDINLAINVPIFAAFIVFPFLFPHRRLPPRAEALLVGGALVYVLAFWTLLLVVPEWFSNSAGNLAASFAVFTPYFAGLIVGCFLLFETYRNSPSDIQRNQARYILAAYLLKTATWAWGFGATSWAVVVEQRPRPDPAWIVEVNHIQGIALAVPILAIPIALMSARWRGRAATRPTSHDMFLLTFVLIGLALNPLVPLAPGSVNTLEIEYMLLRPLLFAFGILQYQMLDVDIRSRRAVMTVLILSGMASVYLLAVWILQDYGVAPHLAAGVGTVVLLGLGAFLAWPIARALLAPPGQNEEPRGRQLYRAALESALDEKRRPDDSNQAILRALRSRLRISDREHAAMEADVRALFGRPVDGLAVGTRFLDRYQVLEVLGEGGFGRAVLAKDEQVGRKVVIKAARAASADEAKRLLREARALARTRHPNIVAVFDVENVAGDLFLVLEHVEGGSLANRLSRGPLPWSATLPLMDGVLAALAFAHGKGIVHRDVKPGNILLGADDRPILADFGVARVPAGSGTAVGLSLAGDQPGSLYYMSPEQVRGASIDHRSDLYSAAVVWYEALAGKPYLEFGGRTEFDARLAVLEERPRLPIPGLPAAVNQLLADALAKEPRNRPATAEEFRARLAALAITKGT
jgi:hypothetical protein